MASMVPHKFPLCTTAHRLDPRTRDESLRLAKKKKMLIAPRELELRRRAFSAIFRVTAQRVQAARQLRLQDVVQTYIFQTLEAILSIFWMTSVTFGQVFRQN